MSAKPLHHIPGLDYLATITSALQDVQNGLDVQIGTNWLGAVYQPANRLAWVWFAREHDSHSADPLPVWLVSIYFCRCAYPRGHGVEIGPADESAWQPHIDKLHEEMGLPEASHALSPRWIEIFLPSTVTELPAPEASRWGR
jgi:hypothetical protein